MNKIIKRIMGWVLAFALLAGFVLIPAPMDIPAEAATVPQIKLCDYIQDGATLHCWNWSIANIRANLGLIANMGYTSIQLSPMQELKEVSTNRPYKDWWVNYQPISFNINTDAGHCVGTRDELVELCKEAHKYGIKVIMDVVCNHTANNGNNSISPLVDAELRNDPSCWHDYTKNSWDYGSRYNITQYCMAGLPDLNTGNQKVQDKALAMLKDYIDCGVDGFRFDAAKQIETPKDDRSFASDFWPTVVGGATDYASSTRGIMLYCYGEMLEQADNNNSLHMSAYTEYMSVTESVWSNDVRYKLQDQKAADLQSSYFKEAGADKLVLWAESHDTFGDGSSVYANQYDLDRAWALISSRAYTMSLFFPRANDMEKQEMGELAKVSWAGKLTREVNLFHNHFAGQGERLTKDSYGNMYYNERGNSGIMIVNFTTGGRYVDIPVYSMANGVYYDQLTGNKFTVSNGRISGQMGDTGVAVVYNPGSKSCNHTSHGSDGYCYSCYTYVGHKSGTTCSACGAASTRTIYFNNNANWSNVYAYSWHDSGAEVTASWPGTKMTKVSGNRYKITLPNNGTNIIFHNGSGTQTANLVVSAQADTYNYNSGFWTKDNERFADYYLFGYINGADYGTGDDYSNMGQYKFVGDQLTVRFNKDSYVGIKTSRNANWYLTKSYVSGTSGTFHDSSTGANEKMLIPGGKDVTLKLTVNTNGTLSLSYQTTTCSHSYTSKITTAAGCTTAGVRTYTCSKCGYSYTAAIAATGHTYSGGKCTTCGASDHTDYYLFGYINGVDYACDKELGSYKFVDGKLKVTFKQECYVGVKTSDNAKWYMTDGWLGKDKTSATLYDKTKLSSPDKLYVPGNVELTFTLTENSNGSLTLSYATTSAEDPVTVPTINLKYPTVSFEEMVLLNIYYEALNVEDVVEMGLITYDTKVTTPNIKTADKVLPGGTWSESAGLYVTSSEGIAAKNLGDTLYFAIYAKLSDGTYAYSKVAGYSPKTYADNQLKTGTDAMKKLVVAMLNYGAAAQTKFGYNTGALVNRDLTAAQKSLISGYSSSMIAAVTQPTAAQMGQMTNNGGYTKRYPTVSFEGVFSINYYFQPSKTPVGNIKMYMWTQADFAAKTPSKSSATKVYTMTATGTSGEYMAVVDGIAAKDLDDVVYVSFCYSDGTTNYCSGVVAYSIGQYCKTQASGTGDMANLAKACAVYGYYAKQRFG